jgi:hypothetical protein
MRRNTVWIFAMSAAGFLAASEAHAHCDTMDGPVVKDAQAALDKGDITPVLKWVKKDVEPELAAAFRKTIAVRKTGPAAKELADRYFLETLVRMHRAGEGAPYTGLKPAGSDLPHAVVAADEVVAGKLPVDTLVEHVSGSVAEGILERWARVAEARKGMNSSVEAGRKYVAAYVEYVHYVEKIALMTSDAAGHAHGAPND